jgi:hypothetical protein
MKTKILLAFVALLSTVSLSAQTATEQQPQLQGIKKRLAEPVANASGTGVSGTVQITEYGDAATIIEQNLYAPPSVMNGYRIVIFTSNTPNARREATDAESKFKGLNTGEKTYLSYDAPYFKVSVGNFIHQEEAVSILGQIHKEFPQAFITQERINIREFTE